MIKPSRVSLSLIAALLVSACGKSPEPIATPAPAPQPVASTPAPMPTGNAAPTDHTASSPAAAVAVAAHPSPSTASAPAPLVFPAPAPVVKAAPANTRVAVFAGLEADIPLSWTPVPPANSMRLAEFKAPTAGQPDAEAVVFFFPPGQGGPQDMNIARWASQFTDTKGEPVKPVVNKAIINNMAVTRIELSGNYSRGVGMGTTEGAVKANQILLAAIVTTPVQGNVTFHFFGPQGSVKKQRESFEAMLRSLRFKG